MVDVIVKVALNCHIRTSKAVISLHNLYIERLCTPSKDIGEHYVKLLLLDIYLLVYTKEDLNLII
jgi:hypothetical protein